MSTYEVPMICTVSTVVKVEADDYESAIEAAYEQGVPGLMFLDHTYPDEGDWSVDEYWEKSMEDRES